MTFKEKIINLRKIKGLTQDEFAKAVGVSRQAVYKWESGQSYPEVPKILEIKLLFNVSIDDLLDDSFDIPLPEKKKRKRNVSAVKAEAVMEVLQENNKALRGELGNKVGKQLRIIPEIIFFLDSSLDYVEHIEELLKK